MNDWKEFGMCYCDCVFTLEGKRDGKPVLYNCLEARTTNPPQKNGILRDEIPLAECRGSAPAD